MFPRSARAPRPSPLLVLAAAAVLVATAAGRVEPAAAAAANPAQAAPAARRDPAEIARALVSEALASGRAYAALGELCRVAPKRLSGSPGAREAVAWAVRTMKAAGLENVREEAVTVPHWERGAPEACALAAPAAVSGETLAVLALGGSVATPAEGIEAPVVEVRSFEEIGALGERARGAILFFNRAMDPALADTFEAYGLAVGQRSRGAIEAAKVGAVAALVRSMTNRIDDHPHTGALNYDDAVPRVPAAAISTRGAERLSALLAEHGDVRVRLTMHCRWLADAPGANVVGELPGAELPAEIVLVGGHLDAWDAAEGAHDDGAGCVQAIEAARLIRAVAPRPRRTIRVVLFANEENGLRGGRAYFDAHRAELEQHVLALESDRGGFAPRGFDTDAGPASFERLREIAARLEPFGAGDLGHGGGGADISPMRAAGVPLMSFVPDCQRYFDVHHSALDTFASVNERELCLGAGVIAAMLREVADLPDPLPRNPPR